MPARHAYELLFKTHWIDEAGNIKLPVDPTAIANAIGVDVKPLPVEEQNLSGEALPEKKLILYNPSDSENRKRFTIAHELGHIVLGHGQAFRDPRQNFNAYCYDVREVQANRFAAALLMPKWAVKALIDKKKITDADKLARIFGVSMQALEIRLRTLGFI